MKKHKTIIIGAGAAGLGCARTLKEKDPNHDFLIISKNIGGRIDKTSNGQIYDGALFALGYYNKVKAIIGMGRLANPLEVTFFDSNVKSHTIFSLIKHPFQLIRVLKVLRKFNKQYLAYSQRAEIVGQKAALEEDPELLKYYSLPASEYTPNSGFKWIAEKYMAYLMYSFAFEPIENISTFDLLRYSLITLSPTHEIIFDEANAIRGFENSILIDELVSFQKNNGLYTLKTKTNKHFEAQNLVIATEPSITKKLLNITEMHEGTSIHIFNISGILHSPYKGRGNYEAFPVGSELIALSKEENETYIVASKNINPNFHHLFSEYKVISSKEWNPAFNLKVSDTLLEADRGDGLYMIGDYNVVGIEEAFITGIYAGNRILKSS